MKLDPQVQREIRNFMDKRVSLRGGSTLIRQTFAAQQIQTLAPPAARLPHHLPVWSERNWSFW
jgi:hypothetical protein